MENAAAASLKDALLSPLVLTMPRHKGCYTFETDASDKQIERVLLHEQEDGSKNPAGYCPLTLNDKERKLAT